MANVRKNQATLTAEEKAQYAGALLKFKREGNPATGMNYDTFVSWHVQIMPFGHRGPAFLPWHREFLRLLEINLQAVAGDPTLTIPYWDWTADNATDATLWGDDFMGGNGRESDDRVVTGPFAFDRGDWTLTVGPTQDLKRHLGSNPPLPTQAAVDAVMALDVYDEAPWSAASDGNVSFRNRLEGWSPNPPILHNQGHVWIGGTMGNRSSPNDPVFFLHHCNVDRLWAEWQDADSGHGYLPLEPLENRPGHGINENLAIFSNDSTVRSVLEYRSLGYEYDTSAAAPAEPAVPLGDIAFVPPEWETNPYGAIA